MLNERKQKIKTNHNIFVKVLGIASLLSLALATILDGIRWIFLFSILGYNVFSGFFIDSLFFLSFGAIPPIGLLIVSIFAKKKTFPIIFLALSALFVFAQLFVSVFNGIVKTIEGNGIIYTLIDDFEILFDLGNEKLTIIISDLTLYLSNLFYILPNVLCFVGFAKLAFIKNKPAVETEETAAEVCEVIESYTSFDAQPVDDTPVETPSATEENNSVKETTEQSCFCRKCGSQLFTDSDFCHKCGTKAVR